MLTTPSMHSPLLRRRAALLCAAALATTAGCSGSSGPEPAAAAAPTTQTSTDGAGTGSATAAYPVTVSRCGREMTYTAAPEKVLLGWATTIRTLDALGVADSVAGYIGQAQPPEGFEGLTEVSADWQPSREVVIGAQPDLLIAESEQQITGEQSISYDDLATAGTNVHVLGDYCVSEAAPADLDSVLQDVQDLGAIFGVPERAAELEEELTARVEAAAAQRGSEEPLNAAFVQVSEGTLYALSGTNYNMIIEGAGLTNEFSDIEANFAEITAEEVLTRQPDLLLVAYEGGEDPDAAVAGATELFANTPAVAEGRVIALSSPEISGSGVNVVEAIEEAAGAAYAP